MAGVGGRTAQRLVDTIGTSRASTLADTLPNSFGLVSAEGVRARGFIAPGARAFAAAGLGLRHVETLASLPRRRGSRRVRLATRHHSEDFGARPVRKRSR